MKILALESSSVAASAAVLEDGILKAEEISQNGLTHSVTLLPMVESALKKAGMTMEDIDLVAVTTGPGSFSGLRIGVTLAKTLAYGIGKKAVGISTLLALAGNLPFADKMICPILDARRDQVYGALYKAENGKFQEVLKPSALSIDELIEKIDEDVIFIGDGIVRFGEHIKEKLGKKAYFAPLSLCLSKASVVATLAQFEEAVDPMDLNPTYLRLSQAEREKLEKEKGE